MSGLQLGSLGAVGKLTSRADFVRLRASHESFSLFEGWLAQNMEWAAARSAKIADFSQAFAQGRLCAFLFRTHADTQSWLAGALGPSSDKAGRQFPFAVATPLSAGPSLLASPELVPLLLEPCWRVASELLVAALGNQQLDFNEQLANGQPEASPPLAEAATSLDLWLQEESLAGLWPHLFAGSTPPEPSEALRWLAATVGPARGIECAETPLSLRLPLGSAGGAAVCFWLALIRQLAGWKRSLPSFFWWHDGATGAMLLHLGSAPRSTLAELWAPSGARDEFFDLTSFRAPRDATGVLPLASGLAGVLENANRPLADLLAAAARC